MHIDTIQVTLNYEGGTKTWDFPYERAISNLDAAVDEFIDHCGADPEQIHFHHSVRGVKHKAEIRVGSEVITKATA